MLRTQQKFLSCSARLRKPIYITTPIFYVNAKPHLGHIYSMLLADTRIRWEQLTPGKKTFFLTGTDEHGLKIQGVAEKEGVSPKELVDRVSQNFKVLAETYNVKEDRFIRTTDADHVEAVQYFWKLMESKDLIYKSSHSGWYSVSDEAFYPESQVKEIVDEKTGLPKRVSIETNNEVFFHEEENYFFRLSAFQDRIIEHIRLNKDFVFPPQKSSELLRLLKEEKLDDLSVLRPSSRLTWGIEVPNDPSQKIYVWFDALINYITAAGYPRLPKHPELNIWPALTHIVGKDIIRFHCIYWPAFLMAAELPLPQQILVHSHWLSNGVKMSKSLGNVVDPIDLSTHYGADPSRLYLMEQANIATDCRFSEEAMYQRRALLLNKWANIGSRIQGGKFLLTRALEKKRFGVFDNFELLYSEHGVSKNKKEVLELVNKLTESVNNLHSDMDAHMARFGQMYATQRWWETVELGNLLFAAAEPWVYSKTLNDGTISEIVRQKHEDIMDFIVYATSEVGRVLSICISPFMPELSKKFLDHLDVEQDKRDSTFCKFGEDSSYGRELVPGKLMGKVTKRH